MSELQVLIGIVGMAVITVITRGYFMLSEREWTMPAWTMRALRYAPLTALAAIIAPEVLLTDGVLVSTWHDPRVLAVAAGTAYFAWRRGILGTIVTGTAVLLATRLGLGW